jgi:hypothetical protein
MTAASPVRHPQAVFADAGGQLATGLGPVLGTWHGEILSLSVMASTNELFGGSRREPIQIIALRIYDFWYFSYASW